MPKKRGKKPTTRQIPRPDDTQDSHELPHTPPRSPVMDSSRDRFGNGKNEPLSSDDEQSNSLPKAVNQAPVPANTLPKPSLPGTVSGPSGSLLKGPTTADGKPKDPLLMVGIKLDLEADIHINARVRGDILVGLY